MSFLHVFPYAAKDHTVAAAMKGQISGVTKRARVSELTALSRQLYNVFVNRFIGKEGMVLFEREVDGYYLGHNSEYIEVKVKSDTDITGLMLPVYYDRAEGEYLEGHIVGGC